MTQNTSSALPRVWFNKNLSSTSFVIQTIRDAVAASCLDGDGFFIVCSHPQANASVVPVADLFEIEPTGLGAKGYVEWCLDFVQRHRIDVFIPRNYASDIAANTERFEALGVKMIQPGSPELLALIKNKGLFYEALGADLVPQPGYKVVANREEFALAFHELSARHNKVCFKPTEGIGGKGFQIITTDGKPIHSSWDNSLLSVDYVEALADFATREDFPELMMMEFLPGQERSVDCLAQDGRLLAGIVRLKSFDGFEELLEDNPLLVEYARRITARVGLHGLYNVQFMESGGVQYLLEVNSRMSGGVHYTAHSGVCLPYWAIRLALGTAQPGDIPEPRTGIRVERATRKVLV